VQAVIIFDSVTGNTRQAANNIADVLFAEGIGSNLLTITDVSEQAIADADLVIVGSWTDGLLVVGQRPGRHKRFTRLLPDLTGKRCAVFCTFAFREGNTLQKLQDIVEAHGGEVLGGMAIRRDDLDGGAAAFTGRVLSAVQGA
jgi:flavodoxin